MDLLCRRSSSFLVGRQWGLLLAKTIWVSIVHTFGVSQRLRNWTTSIILYKPVVNLSPGQHYFHPFIPDRIPVCHILIIWWHPIVLNASGTLTYEYKHDATVTKVLVWIPLNRFRPNTEKTSHDWAQNSITTHWQGSNECCIVRFRSVACCPALWSSFGWGPP